MIHEQYILVNRWPYAIIEAVIDIGSEHWQRRRSEFNHDWLKNRYMQNVGKFINLLDGRVVDHGWIATFLNELLPEWEPQREVARQLILDYKNEISPRRLFARLPLSRCDLATKLWLEALAESLWIHRCSVEQWINLALSAVQRADEAYGELRNKTCMPEKGLTLEQLRPCRLRVCEFRERCQELADAISGYPREALWP